VRQIEHGYALLRGGQLQAALEHISQLLALRPDDTSVQVLASETQLAHRNHDGALAHIDRAIGASGGDAALQLKKATLLVHLRRRSEAIATVAAAADRQPDNGRVQWHAGSLANHCNRPGLALEYYAKARALLGEQPGLLYDIAVAQFFTGDFDGAEANLDRMLAMTPTAGHAMYLRATLRRQSHTANHVQDLQARLARGLAPADAEAAALYALSKELADLGEHERAFSTLEAAARTKRSTLQYSVSSEAAAIGEVMQAYNASVMASHTEGHGDVGAIFIVGMPRTGTTLVERLLVQQGSVVSAGELLDFGNLVGDYAQRSLGPSRGETPAQASLRIDFASLGREYMRGAREAAMGSPRFIDKMPVNYLYCGLIRKALPEARIIHLRRDPLDCCYAVYKTQFFNAYHFSYTLEELADYYIAYHRMMEHWHSVMPGAILEVRYEELVDDTEAQARRIIEWCGLPWDPAILSASPDKVAFATASAAQVREPVHRRSVGSSRRHLAALRPLVDRLAAAGIPVN
jgi:tetratricopeptide (TPR) repeat protein